MVNSDLCQINRPYFGRKIANKWKEQAKLVLFPFGVDLRVRDK